jgi:hypothetical protein
MISRLFYINFTLENVFMMFSTISLIYFICFFYKKETVGSNTRELRVYCNKIYSVL